MRGNNPDTPDVRPPRWATCETCRWCIKGSAALDIVLGMMDDADRRLIEAKYGMCADAAYDKVFVRLDTPPSEMACEGESWSLA